MTSSMSHGNRWWRAASKLSLSTRFVCARRSLSTNSWLSLFLLLEWIHPSIDQQCSQADAEHMTPEALYANQASSLKMGCPVLLSLPPSRTFLSMLLEKASSFWVWTHHERSPSPHHQSDAVHTMLSVEIDKVMRNLMSWRYWHTCFVVLHVWWTCSPFY